MARRRWKSRIVFSEIQFEYCADYDVHLMTPFSPRYLWQIVLSYTIRIYTSSVWKMLPLLIPPTPRLLIDLWWGEDYFFPRYNIHHLTSSKRREVYISAIKLDGKIGFARSELVSSEWELDASLRRLISCEINAIWKVNLIFQRFVLYFNWWMESYEIQFLKNFFFG